MKTFIKTICKVLLLSPSLLLLNPKISKAVEPASFKMLNIKEVITERKIWFYNYDLTSERENYGKRKDTPAPSLVYKDGTSSSVGIMAATNLYVGGNFFFKDTHADNALIIGFLPYETVINGNTTKTVNFRCIKNPSALLNNEAPITLHKNYYFRVPSTPGRYYFFVTNLRNTKAGNNIVTANNNFDSDQTLRTICTSQDNSANSILYESHTLIPSAYKSYSAEIKNYSKSSSRDELNLFVSPTGANSTSNLTSKIIRNSSNTPLLVYVTPPECAAETVANVNWPKTSAGNTTSGTSSTTVNATSSMCTRGTLVNSTSRTCSIDPNTGGATWSSVSGDGCKQSCPAVTGNGFNAPFLYEGESITYHAGSRKEVAMWNHQEQWYPSNIYTKTDQGRSLGADYAACTNNGEILDKSTRISCLATPSGANGSRNFAAANSGSAGTCGPITGRYNDKWTDWNWYGRIDGFIGNPGGSPDPNSWQGGDYGRVQAYYSHRNPFGRGWDKRPNDGDRVLSLIDLSVKGKDVDLSGANAYWRTAGNGYLEIDGTTAYNPVTTKPGNANSPQYGFHIWATWWMNNRFAIVHNFDVTNKTVSGLQNLFTITGNNLYAGFGIDTSIRNDGTYDIQYLYRGGPYNSWDNGKSCALNHTDTYFRSGNPEVATMQDTRVMARIWEVPNFSTGLANEYNSCYREGCRYCYWLTTSPIQVSKTNGTLKKPNSWCNGQSLGNQNWRSWQEKPGIMIGDVGVKHKFYSAIVMKWQVNGSDDDQPPRYFYDRTYGNSWGWYNSGGANGVYNICSGVSVTNNFYMERQKTLEDYWVMAHRYWFRQDYGWYEDDCWGYQWVTNDKSRFSWWWINPCKYGAAGNTFDGTNYNWGRY
ncbi:MAG: hypothetical protein J0H68_00695 [Sphingobacteriia bacterium]|nr:hypothetical protein [Sphingobacteriia bacterium]